MKTSPLPVLPVLPHSTLSLSGTLCSLYPAASHGSQHLQGPGPVGKIPLSPLPWDDFSAVCLLLLL